MNSWDVGLTKRRYLVTVYIEHHNGQWFATGIMRGADTMCSVKQFWRRGDALVWAWEFVSRVSD